MIFVYSSYQTYCMNLQNQVDENFPKDSLFRIPPGALEGVLNTAFLSCAGNLILSRGKLKPAIQGGLGGLFIKILELAVRISYKILQDYLSLARQKTVSNEISPSGEVIAIAMSGVGLWGATHYFKISKISILATAVLFMLRKMTRSETVEILFWIPNH